MLTRLGLLLSLLASGAAAATLGEVTVPAGPDGTLSLRLWVPDGAAQVRGILVACHPSGSGPKPAFQQDYRPSANTTPAWAETVTTEWNAGNRADLALQLVAKRHVFALVGLYFTDQKPGGAGPGKVGMMDAHAAALDAGVTLLATTCKRPELATAPIATYGFSGGSGFAAYYAAANPARCLAFAHNKGASIGDYDPAKLAAAETVPGLLCFGELDKPERLAAIQRTFATHRANGARWSLIPDYGLAHDSQGYGRFLGAAFLDRVIELRLPRDWVPGTAPKLRPLAEDSGWLGDHRTWDGSGSSIVAATDSRAPVVTARTMSWLPDHGFAKAWRAVTTRKPLARLSSPVSTKSTTRPAQLAYLPAGGSQVLGLATSGLAAADWWDGDAPLQTVTTAPFATTLTAPAPGLHLVHAEVRQVDGSSGSSDLAILLVQDGG